MASLAGAHPITRDQHPELWQAVEAAAVGAGLPRTPDVYIIVESIATAYWLDKEHDVILGCAIQTNDVPDFACDFIDETINAEEEAAIRAALKAVVTLAQRVKDNN